MTCLQFKHGGNKSLKARTHSPTFAESALESALESADPSSESADSSAYTPVGM